MVKRIAFFVGQITHDYQNRLVRSVGITAQHLGYQLDIFSEFGMFGENFLHTEGEKKIIHLPFLEDYCGIILAQDTFNIKDMFNELAAKIETETDAPVVCIRDEDPRFYNILIDDYGAMTEVVEHLIKVHHLERISFMTGRMDVRDARRRLKAYEDTMQKNGLTVNEHMVFEGDYWKYQGEEAVTWFLEEEKQPQAIVCSNDYMALSVIEALRKRGIKVPEEIKVTGFDAVEEAKYCEPPLASVDVPVERMGEAAVVTVDRLLSGKVCDKYNYIPVKCELTGTCGCPCNSLDMRMVDMLAKNKFLEQSIQRISFMTVDFEGCITFEELMRTAFVSSYNFSYDEMYLCLCDNDKENDEQFLAYESYTTKMHLRAVMSRNLGLNLCDEVFDRRDILPERYKEDVGVNYIFPLHFKNHCMGYLVLRSDNLEQLYAVFAAWVMALGSYIERIDIYHADRQMMDLRMQALVDELTGMYNRRMWEKEMRYRSQQSYSRAINFCVIALDMDDLKEINDNYGHNEGDCALKALADILKSVQKVGVLATRVGGDEFSLCVDSDDEKVVQDLICEIQNKISAYNQSSGKQYKLSASTGYAFYQRGKELTDCLERADQNMYENKKRKKVGRDFKESSN